MVNELSVHITDGHGNTKKHFSESAEILTPLRSHGKYWPQHLRLCTPQCIVTFFCLLVYQQACRAPQNQGAIRTLGFVEPFMDCLAETPFSWKLRHKSSRAKSCSFGGEKKCPRGFSGSDADRTNRTNAVCIHSYESICMPLPWTSLPSGS